MNPRLAALFFFGEGREPMQLSICSECGKAVYVDVETEPYVFVQETEQNMHADCYDAMIERKNAEKTKTAKA
jgi:hypothetical protein